MRQTIVCLSLVFAVLLNGCDSGVDADLKKSGAELRTSAKSMSDSDLQTRISELEKRSQELQKKVGDKEPSEPEMQQMTKLIEAGGIYATELMNRKLK